MSTPCPLRKPATSSSRARMKTGNHRSLRSFAMSRDSERLDKEDMITGRCSPSSFARRLSPPVEVCSEVELTVSALDQQQRIDMSGKTTPVSRVLDLNMEQSLSSEIQASTGTQSGTWLNQDPSSSYHLPYEFSIIGLSGQSLQTLLNHLLLRDLVTSFGVRLELESRDELGQKPDWELTLKIPERNFGVGTEVKTTLSWMNLEEVNFN